MEIKPIKLSAVQPIQVQPVQVKPVQVQAVQVQTQATGDSKALMGTLFGNGAIKNSEAVEQKTALDVSKQERQDEIKKAVEKVEAKSGGKTEPKKTESKYTGPREIKVYGMTLYTEEDPKVSLESIRQKIVSEYHYPEFSASRTVMTIDDETGIVVPVIKFEKKG